MLCTYYAKRRIDPISDIRLIIRVGVGVQGGSVSVLGIHFVRQNGFILRNMSNRKAAIVLKQEIEEKS